MHQKIKWMFGVDSLGDNFTVCFCFQISLTSCEQISATLLCEYNIVNRANSQNCKNKTQVVLNFNYPVKERGECKYMHCDLSYLLKTAIISVDHSCPPLSGTYSFKAYRFSVNLNAQCSFHCYHPNNKFKKIFSL